MTFNLDGPRAVTLVVEGVCWLAFGAILIAGKRGASRAQIKQDAKSHLGFFLQGAAYVICLCFPRAVFVPFAPASKVAEVVVGALACGIAIGSTWLCYAAARALGKQWALVARVVEGHELISEGPYAIVRNPIYLAMLGMLVAMGLAVSRWEAFVAAAIVFFAGTAIRIGTEERLLKEALGAKFEEYARRVPAFFPRIC